ncbi:hypothetical protein GCM10027294_13220 [Marinactinospora endophytica]
MSTDPDHPPASSQPRPGVPGSSPSANYAAFCRESERARELGWHLTHTERWYGWEYTLTSWDGGHSETFSWLAEVQVRLHQIAEAHR